MILSNLLSASEAFILNLFKNFIENSTSRHPKKCPYCACKEHMHLHCYRKRKFYIVLSKMVVPLYTYLCRFRCPSCKKTFTNYPKLFEKYKRYTFQMLRICKVYLKDIDAVKDAEKKKNEEKEARENAEMKEEEEEKKKAMTLRQTVKAKDNQSLLHEEDTEHGSALSHTTVWRWFSNTRLYEKLNRYYHLTGNLIKGGQSDVFSSKFRSIRRYAILKCFEDFYYVTEKVVEEVWKDLLVHRVWNSCFELLS